MAVMSHEEIGARAAQVLGSEGRATPPVDLAARAAAAAFAAAPLRGPAFLDEWFAGLAQLVRPAAGLACAAALVLVAVAYARGDAAVTTADVRSLGVSEPSFALLEEDG